MSFRVYDVFNGHLHKSAGNEVITKTFIFPINPV